MFTTSMGLYLGFRWLYLPAAQHIKPVHMDFGLPNATAFVEKPLLPLSTMQLVEKGYARLLRSGQAYDISLTFDVPDSVVNQEYGMFMVSLTLASGDKTAVVESRRSCMLRYRSWLLRTLWTVAYSPAYLVGFMEEKQTLRVFMFEDFYDNAAHPVSLATVRLSKPVQMYGATLHFDAHFTGLRAFLYWYPELAGLTFVGVFFSAQAVFYLALYLIYYFQVSMSKEEDEEYIRRVGGRPHHRDNPSSRRSDYSTGTYGRRDHDTLDADDVDLSYSHQSSMRDTNEGLSADESGIESVEETRREKTRRESGGEGGSGSSGVDGRGPGGMIAEEEEVGGEGTETIMPGGEGKLESPGVEGAELRKRLGKLAAQRDD